MTTEETIAFLEGHEDETFALAKQLANVISYHNSVELNALRMMRILEPVMRDNARLEWLFRTHGHTINQHGAANIIRFEWPFADPDWRAAIDAARKQPSR